MEPTISFFNNNDELSEKERKQLPKEDKIEQMEQSEEDGSPSEKELIIESLEQRESIPSNSVTLEFGDIIELMAPTNPDVDGIVAIITYIDNEKIKLVNVNNYQQYKLKITPDGTFTDESITQINILSRSKEKGYARQNNLLPRTWIDIHFGGDVPAIITGEITNLEGDMIEITTFPELSVIYINFGYKGLPENIPIDSIKIRNKPAAVTVATLAVLKGVDMPPQAEGTNGNEGNEASIEYTESGESIVTIPKDVVAERNIHDELNDLYKESSGDIIFGENLGEIYQLVEIPEENQRYGIDVQVNDIMDEMLSTIPNSQRTKAVIDNIHLLIERYKQLRELYSKFDKNANVYDIKMLGAAHKPLIDRLKNMDTNLRWLIPTSTTRKRLYDTGPSIDSAEIVAEVLGDSLRKLERQQLAYYKENSKDPTLSYASICGEVQETLTPFSPPLQARLYTGPIRTNLESVVFNQDDFYSTTFHNGEAGRRQYVIQRYNLGFSGLEDQVMKTGKTIYLRKPIGPSDTIAVRSFLMMPEPLIRYSAVDLPGSSLMDRTNLSLTPFVPYRYFKRRLTVQPHAITDLTREFNYEKLEKELNKSVFADLHEFFLGDEAATVDEDRFQQFLEVMVPKTRFLIRIIRKFLNNRLSFIDMVKCLEPFAVYPSDVTYKQYLEIRHVIKERIEELKVEIEKRSNVFMMLRNAKFPVSPLPNPLLRLILDKNDYADSFEKAYEFLGTDKVVKAHLSTSEILQAMNDRDDGELYTLFLKSILITLVTPNQLLDVLAEPNIDETNAEEEKIQPSDCARKYLAKRYTSIAEMQKDNTLDEIFYDKDLDDTPYSILKRYEKQRKEMLPELFTEFLEQTLVSKHDCPPNLAPELARTLIAGNKKVVDGDYAILELRPTLPADVDAETLSEREQEAIAVEADIRKRTQYYRRMKNNWIKDSDIDEESFLDTNALFCNVSEKCIKNQANKVCETLDEAALRMREIARKKLLGEFDKRYTVNVDELKKEVEANLNTHLKQLKRQYDLNNIHMLKQSRVAYALGTLRGSQADGVQSPHLQLRDLILGQDDFTKKQSDICRFVLQYCRDPLVEQQEEDPHWKYCKDTNAKLFPFSLYELAQQFVAGLDYPRKLDQVCAKYGILSDDGDAIVDKYSGFVLRKIDFSSEEGFDEAGFRITSKDILEQDLGATLVTESKAVRDRVFENETAETVFNVLSTICRNIDIPLATVEDFVMRQSLEMFDKVIYTEAAYNKKSDKQLKEKGKALQPYKNYRDETRLTIIACNLLIAVQTAIPSLQSKRTFPGCVRSFSGFPLGGGVEDITGIQYLACVLHKTTSSISIWESIKKYKPETLVKRMKDIFDSFIMKRSDVIELYTKKREYMSLHPETVSPLEHDISRWRHFMPPVVPIHMTKHLQTVASDFEDDLKSLVRRGSSRQTESINIVTSKILSFGYGIIDAVQGVVEKKDTLLKTSGNVPFLENACCNERDDQNVQPIKYFIGEAEQIAQYIRNVVLLSRTQAMTKQAATAPMLFHNAFTGIRHSSVSANNLDDPTLIYAAIIHYCQFDTGLPIPDKYKAICSEIPEGYRSDWTLLEKIEFMKKNGVQYRVDDLLRLMGLVHQENIVENEVAVELGASTKIHVIKEVVEQLDMENSHIVDEPLRKLLFRLLESHRPKTMLHEVSDEINSLQNYLLKTNKEMYREIMDFFGRYGNLSDARYTRLHTFLKDICVWKLDQPMKETGLYYDTGLYTVTQFVQNAVQAMSKTYPNILLNDVGFYKKVHKHWGFSERHNAILSQFINKYYEKLETFKQDAVINRLLMEVGRRLASLNLFLQNLPVHTEMVKDLGENGVRTFYHLLDKNTTYMLFSYCFYSVLFEYINCTNEADLLRADVEEVKRGRRTAIKEGSDIASHLRGEETDTNEDLVEREMELNEVEVRIGNTEELKGRVAALLLSFLEIEEENKKTVDMSYDDIQQKVRRNKNIERQGIIDRLTKMSIEQRKVEDSLKKYRLEHWNVGQQKGLYEYDANAYDRELDQMLFGPDNDAVDSDTFGVATDVNQLDAADRAAADDLERIDYGRNAIDMGIANVDDGELDGDYYYNDGDAGDFAD